jgi:hypothetical protein
MAQNIYIYIYTLCPYINIYIERYIYIYIYTYNCIHYIYQDEIAWANFNRWRDAWQSPWHHMPILEQISSKYILAAFSNDFLRDATRAELFSAW